eukprot:g4755.t1
MQEKQDKIADEWMHASKEKSKTAMECGEKEKQLIEEEEKEKQLTAEKFREKKGKIHAEAQEKTRQLDQIMEEAERESMLSNQLQFAEGSTKRQVVKSLERPTPYLSKSLERAAIARAVLFRLEDEKASQARSSSSSSSTGTELQHYAFIPGSSVAMVSAVMQKHEAIVGKSASGQQLLQRREVIAEETDTQRRQAMLENTDTEFNKLLLARMMREGYADAKKLLGAFSFLATDAASSESVQLLKAALEMVLCGLPSSEHLSTLFRDLNRNRDPGNELAHKIETFVLRAALSGFTYHVEDEAEVVAWILDNIEEDAPAKSAAEVNQLKKKKEND